MGDVDVKQVKNIDPVTIKEIQRISNIEPLRVAKIAPAAIHVKELNQIDPITVESLRVDDVRNVEPLRIERFDVTHLPTVNLTLGEAPALDVNMRRMPPLAVGIHQDFCLPSEYTIRARVLGLELVRVQVSGRTVVRPHDRARREVSATHERSQREVAAVGNPAIPVSDRETSAEAMALRPPRRRPKARVHARRSPARMARGQLSVGPPPAAFPVAPGPPRDTGFESAVASW